MVYLEKVISYVDKVSFHPCDLPDSQCWFETGLQFYPILVLEY